MLTSTQHQLKLYPAPSCNSWGFIIWTYSVLYIVTEGSIICQLPQEKILDAVLGLLGSFYTSIMYTYTQFKAILAFLE